MQNLESQLTELGFERKQTGVFEKGDELKFTVAPVSGQLCIYVSIRDPFHTPGDLYVTCFIGQLRQEGLETRTAFSSVYKPASGAESQDPSLFRNYASAWMECFSTAEQVSAALTTALQKRREHSQAGTRWKLFEAIAGRVVKTPPPTSKTPPIFHYLQALLNFHSARFDDAIAEANRYLGTLRVRDTEEERMARLIQAAAEGKARCSSHWT